LTAHFSGATRGEAWFAATEHLLHVGRDINLILSIQSPKDGAAKDTDLRREVDGFCAGEGQSPLHTVAETIFPAWLYRRKGLQGMFDEYPEQYAILKRQSPLNWGTYAHRIMRRHTCTGEFVNPLSDLIRNMKAELGHEVGGTFAARYDIGIADEGYELPTYSTLADQGRRRNLPCLSHLSFKLFEGRVHLTAIYRSHEYRYKTLGNLLGLARLQACVAKEVGMPVGTLVIHSTYAFIDMSHGKTPLRKLLARVQPLL